MRPFAIKERYILNRGDLFNETATSQKYANSLRKVRYVRHEPIRWDAKGVVRAAYGLRLASGNRNRFPNFIRSEIARMLIRHFGGNDEFTRMAYISFLFALRVPSETLHMRRAHKGARWAIPHLNVKWCS